MAFDKYKDGAWQEPDDTVKRYADGAWQEAESAKRYISGAWTEVWEAIKYMSQMNNTLPSGSIVGAVTGGDSDREGWAIWFFEGDNDGGSVTYFLDGEFVNPSISFDYDGFFSFTPNGTLTYSSVGKLEVYTRTADGTESYTIADNSVEKVEGVDSFSTTLNGTFNRVGFRFTFTNWNVSADMTPQYLFNIWNIVIDGKDCLPSKE